MTSGQPAAPPSRKALDRTAAGGNFGEVSKWRLDFLSPGLSQDDWKQGRDRIKGAGMRIAIEAAQDIDELAASAKSAGINLQSEPHDTPWGERAFEATDPDGFKLTIYTKGTES